MAKRKHRILGAQHKLLFESGLGLCKQLERDPSCEPTTWRDQLSIVWRTPSRSTTTSAAVRSDKSNRNWIYIPCETTLCCWVGTMYNVLWGDVNETLSSLLSWIINFIRSCFRCRYLWTVSLRIIQSTVWSGCVYWRVSLLHLSFVWDIPWTTTTSKWAGQIHRFRYSIPARTDSNWPQ